jgi:hypothetical protein
VVQDKFFHFLESAVSDLASEQELADLVSALYLDLGPSAELRAADLSVDFRSEELVEASQWRVAVLAIFFRQTVALAAVDFQSLVVTSVFRASVEEEFFQRFRDLGVRGAVKLASWVDNLVDGAPVHCRAEILDLGTIKVLARG